MIELTVVESRVLGCLVEKAFTTPDHYPLTLNALTLACNQTSNRQPVMVVSEDEVLDAMRVLRDLNLARSVRTARSRSMKHQHDIESALLVDGPSAALLSVLLLRGPQTPGELRSRTERYHDFDTLDEVETRLREMADDDPALVQQLERQPGQKEHRWVQLLSTPSHPGDPVPTAPPEEDRPATTLEARIEALESRLADVERHLGL